MSWHWRRGHLVWFSAAANISVAKPERCAAIVERRTDARLVTAIGTALKAGYRWLDVYCAGCGQVKSVDLAAVDVHPQAGLTRCCGAASAVATDHCRGWLACRASRLAPLRLGNERRPADVTGRE
jgi:hypothetical protein